MGEGILLVDPASSFVQFVSLVLGRLGHGTIDHASNAELALEKTARWTPQLVFSEVRLPAMSGPDFLAAVRKLHPNVIRVLISAKLDTGALAEAVNAARIHKFISKDWDAKRLRSEVRAAYLRRRRAGD